MEIKGTVKIIKSLEDHNEIKLGDILFMKNATPDLYPHFKNITAIVAETGSLLSHAAILARENQIPHIIGIKNATRLVEQGTTIIINTKTKEIKKC